MAVGVGCIDTRTVDQMVRRRVRILGFVIGVCLFVGAALSLVLWLGPQTGTWRQSLRQLGAFVDVIALVVWMGIFAIYWSSRDPS